VADEFVFEVKDVDGNVVSTGKNDVDGNILFDKKLTFTEKGNYTFAVYEVTGDDTQITYDGTVHTIIVTVTDDEKGTLTAEVAYGADGTGAVPSFKNIHTPGAAAIVLEAMKVLNGRDLTDGEFTFEVKDETGNVVATAKNDADGKIVFNEIKLNAGDYTFTIYEVVGDVKDTIYDKKEFKVTVNVSDTDSDGVFEHKITYPEGGVKFINEHYEVVDTGDNSQMILWGAMAALCVVAVGVLLVIRKKMK
jgi:pilin isopeptide linkage protein